MKIRFYLDEDVPVQLAKAMQLRGIGVMTTQEAGDSGPQYKFIIDFFIFIVHLS